MRNPKVSVIVPNYNHAPYLRQRLDSIYNQTSKDFEVIILDDCSTDNSKEIIEKYRNYPQTSYIVYNEVNSGSPFKQWAKGFDLTQGEYIWIAESDDWAELSFLETLVPILNKDESLSLAFCESFWEYSERTTFGQLLTKNTFFKGLDFIKKRQIFNNNIVNASSVLFRRNILSKISSDYQEFQGSGDYILWSYFCEQGNIYYLKKRLNHFRRHNSTTTSKSFATGQAIIENHRIYKYFKNKGYLSNFEKYRIVNYNLKQIEANKDILEKNEVYKQCRSLWEDEKESDKLTSSIFTFLAKQMNEYYNLPFYAKLWKLFRLPDTNFRGRLFKKFTK